MAFAFFAAECEVGPVPVVVTRCRETVFSSRTTQTVEYVPRVGIETLELVDAVGVLGFLGKDVAAAHAGALKVSGIPSSPPCLPPRAESFLFSPLRARRRTRNQSCPPPRRS